MYYCKYATHILFFFNTASLNSRWAVFFLSICIYISSSPCSKARVCFFFQTAVRRLTIPSKNTHPVCKKNNIFHSDIVQDHSLKRGINPKNYTLLGQVPTMGDCMALCCATKHCNIAYMKNETCYGVTCYDAEKCSVGNATASFDSSGTQLALIIRNEMNRRGIFLNVSRYFNVCSVKQCIDPT